MRQRGLMAPSRSAAPQRWRQERRALSGDGQVATVDPARPDERHFRAPYAALGARTSLEPYRVSCVMPAYNEREAIGPAVTHLLRAAQRLTSAFEIIVVDDGSTDGTGQILEEMRVENLRVVRLPQNRGYGRALRAGFSAAVHPLVFFTDSDNQFDATELGRLLPLVAEADIVAGYRVGRGDGALRSVFSQTYRALEIGIGDRRDAVRDAGPGCDERDAELARQQRVRGRHVNGRAFVPDIHDRDAIRCEPIEGRTEANPARVPAGRRASLRHSQRQWTPPPGRRSHLVANSLRARLPAAVRGVVWSRMRTSALRISALLLAALLILALLRPLLSSASLAPQQILRVYFEPGAHDDVAVAVDEGILDT